MHSQAIPIAQIERTTDERLNGRIDQLAFATEGFLDLFFLGANFLVVGEVLVLAATTGLKIGAGGWLSGDARLVNGDPFEAEDLISSLKLEISAALEGIEEATYLKGLITEMVRYGESVQRASRPPKSAPETPAGKKHKPVLLPSTNEDLALLPVGLKAEQLISLLRVGAGGEVTQRSARDIGQLKSRNVAAYSLERIIV